MPELQKYFNNLQSIDPEHEMELQLEATYHDARGGLILSHSFCRDEKSDRGKKTYMRAFTEGYQTSCYPVKEDVDSYTALCTFVDGKPDKRSASNQSGFNRGIFYIDIDCHKAGASATEQSVRRACELLTKAYENGVLPIPTLINYTGRGLAVYYIMERFLALKTPNTEKSHWKFKSVYNSLWKRYKALLEVPECPGIEVDGNVRNTARLVRVAGTYNTAADRKCHLVWRNCDDAGNTVYVQNFSDLAMAKPLQELGTRNWELGGGRRNKEEKPVRPQSMTLAMKHRVEAMKALAVLRAKRGTEGYRHAIALVTYNAALVCDHERAYDALWEVNQTFLHPLSERELTQIEETTRHAGGYRFTTQTVRECTGMTAEEESLIGLRKPLSVTKRKKESIERQQKKEEQRLQIAKTILHNPGLTYKEIGELFSVSENTVKRIAKDYKVARNGDKKRMTDKILEAVRDTKVSKLTSSIGVGVEASRNQPQNRPPQDTRHSLRGAERVAGGQREGMHAVPGTTAPTGSRRTDSQTLPGDHCIPLTGTAAASVALSVSTVSKPAGEKSAHEQPVKKGRGAKASHTTFFAWDDCGLSELFERYADSSWARRLRGNSSGAYCTG